MRWLLVATPTPSPSASLAVDPDAVTPGTIGFITMLLLTVAVVLLVLDMVRRIRRVRYRGEFAERRDAAEQEQRDRSQS